MTNAIAAMTPRKYALILASLLAIAALAGCSKLTMENYDKINVGMHYDEVVKLIGKPDRCDDTMGIRSCEWHDGKATVHVNFLGDQAMLHASENLK